MANKISSQFKKKEEAHYSILKVMDKETKILSNKINYSLNWGKK